MDWKNVASTIAGVAPKLAAVLAATGVGAPAAAAVAAAGSLIGATLGVPATPDDVAVALNNPDAMVKLRQIEADHGDHLAQLAQLAEAKQLDADNAALSTVNATMQKEDETRSFSWRDFWGYVSGTAFAFVVGVVCYLVGSAVYLTKPELLSFIPSIVGAFTALFGIAATVLGVHSAIEAHHSGMTDRIAAGGEQK